MTLYDVGAYSFLVAALLWPSALAVDPAKEDLLLRGRRSLQDLSLVVPVTSDVEACSALADDVFWWGGYGNIYVLSDFYEGCMGSLAINGTNMIEHIIHLNEIFKQYQ